MSILDRSVYDPTLGRELPIRPTVQLSPELRRMIERRQQQATPEVPLTTQRHGFWAQFVYGTSSPIQMVGRGLGLIDRTKPGPPDPQGFAEGVARFAGSVLGYGALLMPVVGPVASGVALGILGKSLAAKTVVGGLTAGKLGTSLATGAIIGSLRAAAEGSEDAAGDILQTMAWYGLIPLAGAGLGAGMKHLGWFQKTVPKLQQLRDSVLGTAPSVSADFRKMSQGLRGAAGLAEAQGPAPAPESWHTASAHAKKGIPSLKRLFNSKSLLEQETRLREAEALAARTKQEILRRLGKSTTADLMTRPDLTVKEQVQLRKALERVLERDTILRDTRAAMTAPGRSVTLEQAKEALVERLQARDLGAATGAVRWSDVGAKLGAGFNRMDQAGQLTAIAHAYRNDPQFETLFRPIFELSRAGLVGESFKATGATQEAMRTVMTREGATDAPDSWTNASKHIKEKIKTLQAVFKQDLTLEQQETALNRAEQIWNKNRGALVKLLGGQKGDTLETMLRKKDLTPRQYQSLVRLAERHAIMQDARWAIHSKLSQAPELRMGDPKLLASRVLATTTGHAPGATVSSVFPNPKMWSLYSEIHQATGVHFTTINEVIRAARGNPALQPWVEKLKAAARDLKASGEPIQVARVGANFYGVPAGVGPEQAFKHITENLKNVPTWDQAARAGTLHEEMMLTLKSKPSFLWNVFAPVRKILGKSFTNAGRAATQGDWEMREEYLGPEKGMMMWQRFLGVKGKTAATAGIRITKFMERKDLVHKEFLEIGKLPMSDPAFQAFAAKYDISDKELQVAVWMRKAYDTMFSRMAQPAPAEGETVTGLNWSQYMENYYPHRVKAKNMDFDEMRRTLLAAGVKPQDIKGYEFIHELHRKGAEFEYIEDAFETFRMYATDAAKHLHYDELFNKWTEAFRTAGASAGRLQVLARMKEHMLGRPTAAEQQIDMAIREVASLFGKEGPGRPTKAISSFIAEMQYLGGLGFNPFTAAKNLTQKILPLTVYTEDGNWLKGVEAYADWKRADPGLRKWINGLNPIIPNRMFQEGIHHTESALEGIADRFGLPREAGRGVRELAFKMYRWSDIDNVQDTFGTQFLHLLKKGAPVLDAIEISTSTTMSTQFMYGFDSPMMYKGPIGRLMGMFMSWPLNWANLLWEQSVEQGQLARAVGIVGLMAVGAEALSLTGLSFMGIHPFNTARGLLPIAMAEGQERWPVALRSGHAAISVLQALSRGDPVAIDQAMNNFQQRLAPLVPLGVVSRRALDFAKLVRNDWREYDRQGRLRREATPGEAIRGLIGPTVEAQQRYQDWQQIQKMDSSYRRMRRVAIDAYLGGDQEKFRTLQEHLLVNFGRWIEPKDIEQELILRELSSVERQAASLPAAARKYFLEEQGIGIRTRDDIRRELGIPVRR